MTTAKKRIGFGRQLTCQSLCVDNGPPRVFSPPLTRTTQTSKYQIYEFGQPAPSAPHKTIVVVGATGSGKSTLINGLFNYIIGVDWEDQFRFKLVQEQQGNQAKSQTQLVTVYTVHHQKGFRVPYTLSFIDTPGYGDTSGVLKDNKISDQLRAFFTSSKQTGIDQVDAIGFVVQASLPRLTTSQQYVFDSILTLFGKDVAKNIYFLVTFADASKPQVLAGIQAAKLPYEGFFKFNNSVLYICKSTEDGDNNSDDLDDDDEDDNVFNDMYWKMGESSYRSFLNALENTQSRSLQMTQQVMTEHKTLELSIKGLQTEIRLGLNKMEQLEREKAVLKQCEADLENNRDFTYTIEEESTEAVAVVTGQYTTNCNQCKRTCHERCSENEDNRKSACSAMSGGFCTVCPGKCHWSKHTNQPYIYRVKRVTITKCAEELRKKYQDTKYKYDALNSNGKLQEEFDDVQERVMKMVKDVRDSTTRLENISLKTNPMSTADYIDLQLKTEQLQAEPGWQWRVKQLQKLKQQAEYKMKIAHNDFSPFKEYQKQKSSGAKFLSKEAEPEEDDDQYRHPKIEKLQTDLNLGKLLMKGPSHLSDPDNEYLTASEGTSPIDDTSDTIGDAALQQSGTTGDIDQFKRKLQLHLSKKLK